MMNQQVQCKIGKKLITSTVGKGKRKGETKVYCKTTKYVISVSQQGDAKMEGEGTEEHAVYDLLIRNESNGNEWLYTFVDHLQRYGKTIILRNKEKLEIVRDLVKNSLAVASYLGISDDEKDDLVKRIDLLIASK